MASFSHIFPGFCPTICFQGSFSYVIGMSPVFSSCLPGRIGWIESLLWTYNFMVANSVSYVWVLCPPTPFLPSSGKQIFPALRKNQNQAQGHYRKWSLETGRWRWCLERSSDFSRGASSSSKVSMEGLCAHLLSSLLDHLLDLCWPKSTALGWGWKCKGVWNVLLV